LNEPGLKGAFSPSWYYQLGLKDFPEKQKKATSASHTHALASLLQAPPPPLLTIIAARTQTKTSIRSHSSSNNNHHNIKVIQFHH
jgi:hypothetical protein